MTETQEQQLKRLGRTAAEKALAPDRDFTITKFSRHEEGYFHARVTAEDKTVYFHRKYGSWMAPGTKGKQHLLKEVEGLFSADVATPIKQALAAKARAMEKQERLDNDRAEGKEVEDATDAGGPSPTDSEDAA